MASQEIQKAIQSYENYISNNGIDESVIDAMIEACKVAYQTEKDIPYALKVSGRTKEIVEQFVMKLTGADIWGLEKYSQESNQQYDLINKYYDILKMESYYMFESFIYCMERKRPFKKRFYQPRRKTLKIVVDDLQNLEDRRKQKFFGLSMPSRVGKSTVCIFFLAYVRWCSL
ncbi:hypothetical protein HMPREF0988_00887 [Lachnospiraceae bacterium 1_4_56FAA]|nr:hypothetical protein HMPREF0988_00887 [Lachnospiraceae bacterium 1_4_56FAA]